MEIFISDYSGKFMAECFIVLRGAMDDYWRRLFDFFATV